jgi:hypothetical protein
MTYYGPDFVAGGTAMLGTRHADLFSMALVDRENHAEVGLFGSIDSSLKLGYPELVIAS